MERELMGTTLKSSLNRMILMTFLLVCLVTVAFIFCYSEIKQTLVNRSLEEALAKTTAAQLEVLVPSFLVPEQQSGVSLLLERFKESEDLTQIEVLKAVSEVPKEFSRCAHRSSPLTCISDDRSKVGILAPISESGQNFGFLFKSKSIPNPFLNDHLLMLIEFASVVLFMAFLLLFLFIGRLTSHDLPNELSNLALWLEQMLSDQTPAKMPQLKYRELNTLGKKITEIIDRHDRIRDQAMIGQLTSGIMHDIRNPLHAMVTAMHLAHEQPCSSPKRLARLESLLTTSLVKIPTIGEIVESTLDVSREIHISLKTIDLRTTLAESVDSHADSALKSHIQIDLNLGSSPLPVAHDPVQLGRVFSNIFRNAIESFDSKTSPRTPEKVRISVDTQSDNLVRISFEDSGVGLPEDADRIFRIFRSTKRRGSGLGLVTSRKIVEAHGGKLVASNSKDLSGACFQVLLPISEGVRELSFNGLEREVS